MDKTHYKELIEKYFEETITDVEIKELSDWIKNDHQLHAANFFSEIIQIT